MPEAQPKLTRQEIYQRIRESSKDEYILEEMIRLGFWPGDQEKPSLTESIIQRRAELTTELRRLGLEQALYDDPEKALRELHKQRKQEALKQREETRRRNNQVRYERRKHWFDKNQSSITYLGEGSAQELIQSQSNAEQLRKQGLPTIESAQDLAKQMGIALHELRFLSYHRDVAKLDHYQHFELVKKTGGTRAIAAPMPRLKRVQYWILDNVLVKLPTSDQAHGFIKKRSIVTNAEPHVGQPVVINMDLKDFFPSITRNRVKGLFAGFGYSEQIAAILSNLCTAPARELIHLDGERFYVASSERCLPQGAPTSPAISNLICRKLDKRIQGTVHDLNVSYSRYADDLTFSFSDTENQHERITKLFWRVRQIVKEEGFTVHPDKTRVMRGHQRQEVTGIVVNQHPNINRKSLKQFRALLHQIDKDGFAGKRWGNGALLPSIEGFANYVAMVNPDKGIPLQTRVAQLKRKYGINVKHGTVLALNKRLLRHKAAQGQAPRDDWWQPSLPSPPKLEKTQEQLNADKQAVKQSSKRNAEDFNSRSSNAEDRIPTPSPQKPKHDTGKQVGTIMLVLAALILVLLIL